MITDDNTAGAVHWGGLFAGTDGEQISLVIPIFCQPQHVPYLSSVLEARLGEFFGDEDVQFRLDPGELTRSERGSSYEQGHLVITGVTEPWPDGAELRKLLEEAVATAGEIEADQMRKARELTRHLRETGDRPN
jgi:hypothetical protein